ncbi:hypothetical protein ACJK9F_002110 [Lelliottia nimipressuralis]|uniref:hypothetical protein n=1 Tax=Lelliottia nimipressuralis TaxID=69220 RepID=UPI0039062954
MTQDIVATSCYADWFEPKIVIPALTAIVIGVLASVIVPIFMHFSKSKREHKYKILDIRTKVYTEYFKKYEEAAAGVGVDYEMFSRVTLKNAFRDLLESNSSPEAIIKFSDEVGRFPFQIQESYRKSTEEISSLKILGSDELFKLTADFERLSQEIINLSTDWLGELNEALVSPDFETPIAKKMKAKGEEVKELKNRIIKQMRNELNIG